MELHHSLDDNVSWLEIVPNPECTESRFSKIAQWRPPSVRVPGDNHPSIIGRLVTYLGHRVNGLEPIDATSLSLSLPERPARRRGTRATITVLAASVILVAQAYIDAPPITKK